jgi:pyruvate formate lyase activating enzyme
MHRALYFENLTDDKVQCLLCPHKCVLKLGQTGICQVRSNRNNVLVSENYGKVSALHLDPIEKKPLYHFYPGSTILSIGSVGCNLQCNFCQNFDISQTGVVDFPWLKEYSSEEIVKKALGTQENIGIAFTYNEPVVFFEYMLDIARLSKSKGLRNVMVSNGFINEDPLKELLPLIDAFNIDLKAMNDGFYKKQTHSQLEPVKQSLQLIRDAGKHLEIANLIIPGLNDDTKDFETMVKWISGALGQDTILHLSRYFPRYKATQPTTEQAVLFTLRKIAKEYLRFVYVGNVDTSEDVNDTICYSCKETLIKRLGYSVVITGLSDDGSCKYCGNSIVSM